MALKVNPFTGNLDIVVNPGGGPVATDFATDSGTAVPTAAGVITIAGSGSITTSGASNTVTIGGGGITWSEVTGTSQSMAVANGYAANNAAQVALTLPSTAAFGDIVRVAGKGAGLWDIVQGASQTIHFGNTDTTTGAGGSVTATNRYDCLELICTVANTDFTVLSSVGNLTLV